MLSAGGKKAQRQMILNREKGKHNINRISGGNYFGFSNPVTGNKPSNNKPSNNKPSVSQHHGSLKDAAKKNPLGGSSEKKR